MHALLPGCTKDVHVVLILLLFAGIHVHVHVCIYRTEFLLKKKGLLRIPKQHIKYKTKEINYIYMYITWTFSHQSGHKKMDKYNVLLILTKIVFLILLRLEHVMRKWYLSSTPFLHKGQLLLLYIHVFNFTIVKHWVGCKEGLILWIYIKKYI